MKNRVSFWKCNKETGNPQYIHFRVYAVTVCLYFLCRFEYGIIFWLCSASTSFSSDEFLNAVLESAYTAGTGALKFFIILYLVMTVIGNIIRAEGDSLQEPLFRALRHRRMYKVASKHIKTIPLRSKRYPTNISRKRLPAVIMVCEKIDVSNGVFRRTPMVLNAMEMTTNGKCIFSQTHMCDLFNKEYVFGGMTALEFLERFNQFSPGIDTLRLLRNCDGLAILEIDVVYDETILRDNIFTDNLLRMQVHKIPCSVTFKGKVEITNFKRFKENEYITRR